MKRLQLGVILLGMMSGLATAFAQGTAFTYQGRLTGASPANGSYGLRFDLRDGIVARSSIGTETSLRPSAQKLAEELKRRDAENDKLKQTVNELKELMKTMNDKLNGGAK